MAAEIAAEALEIEKLRAEEELLKKAEKEFAKDLPELEDVSREV